MYCRLLLSVLLFSTLAYGATDFQAQYCSLKTNTTGEIAIGVIPSNLARQSTQFILDTQSFTSNGGVVSLSYIENEGSFTIEETDSTLTTIVHTDGISNDLVYIDSRNQYILAKEITDQTTAEFDYVLLTATLGTAGVMTKFEISSQVDSTSTDISKLSIAKIIDVTSTHIYVILSGQDSSSVYKISVSAESDLIFYADLSTTVALDIIGGNSKYIYDSSSESFYVLNTTSTVSYTAKSFADLGIDSILTASTLEFTHLNGLVLAYSSKSGVTNILPIDLDTIDPTGAVQITGTATIHTDDYKNLVAITADELVWIRVADSGVESVKLSTTSLNSTVKSSILSIFDQAQWVSFDGDSAVVIKQEASNIRSSLYSVSFDLLATDVLTIDDEYVNAFDNEAASFTELVSPSAVSGYQTSYSCNCVSLYVERIECFASALKCLTFTNVKREVCTKA